MEFNIIQLRKIYMKNHSSVHSWLNVAVFDGFAAGEALRALLAKEGFVVRIHDERKLQRYWFLVPPQAGIYVQTPKDSLGAVQKFLDESAEARMLLRDSIRCPSCHSPNVQYPQMTRKFILPTIFAHVLILLRIMEPDCYCEDCHYEWVRSPRTHPTSAPLKPT